ncbi:MAG TPA: type VI secretion system tip protein TssI/VgrG [Polyangiaceae bacterium]|nr:type VI secretion system tip protein TssI/VgrG [Polyangiaceae bacterium]
MKAQVEAHLYLSGSLASQLVLTVDEVEELNRPRSTSVRLLLLAETPLADLLGQPAQLQLIDDLGTERFVSGYVADVNLVASAEPESEAERVYPTYDLSIASTLQLLGGIVDCRIFQDLTTPDIVKAVLEEWGIAADRQDWLLSGQYEPRVYSVQYRESCLAYVSRLLEDEGIFFFSRVDEQGIETFHFRDDSSAAQASPEGATPLRVATGSNQDGYSVFALAEGVEATSGKTSLQSFDFEKPALSLESSFETGSLNELENYGAQEPYASLERGRVLSKVRQEELSARARSVTFVTNDPRVGAGSSFRIEAQPKARDLFVTRVAHSFELTPEGASDGTPGYRAEVRALPLAQAFRPPRRHPQPRIVGPQTAIVVGPSGAEPETVHTDAYGRVKVRFHWDRRTDGTERTACWMRVAQLQTSGSMVLPRIHWEVVVEFVDGNPDQPIVTGRLYNAGFGPPYALPEGKTRMSLQSASSPAGGGRNEVRFEDAAGSEEMMVHSQYNTAIAAANNRKKNITKNETLVVGNNAKLEVGGDQTIQVTGGAKSTVKGNQKLTVSGNRKSEVNAVYGQTVKGSSTTSIQGNWMSMVGSPLDALISLGIAKAADVVAGKADQVLQSLNSAAQGAVEQVQGALSGLTSGTDTIAAGMAEMANGKMAAASAVLGGAVALPGAGDVMNSLAQAPAMARAAEGTDSSSGGIALGALVRGAAISQLQQAQKSARAALGAATGESAAATDVVSQANQAGPVGDLSGFSSEDTATGPGYSQTTVNSTHDETVGGSRIQMALEPISVNVKTTISETVGAAHVEVIGADRAESVEGASSETEAGLVIVAKGGENLTVHGACQISVGGAIQETVNGDYSIESDVSISLIGAMHDYKAKGKITITCGASSLVVDGAGVSLTSPVVNLSGSSVQVTGSVSDG